METMEKTQITVSTTVKAPVEKVWKFWNEPEDIKQWNAASDDWHTTQSENDLREGGKFSSRMEAKDGSFGFDFGGVYDEVTLYKRITYTMADGRKVQVDFSGVEETTIIETFDAEKTHELEMQRAGWQAIMDNFKKYAEANAQDKM